MLIFHLSEPWERRKRRGSLEYCFLLFLCFTFAVSKRGKGGGEKKGEGKGEKGRDDSLRVVQAIR